MRGNVTQTREYLDWRWTLSCVCSEMMVFSAQLAEEGAHAPSPFHSLYLPPSFELPRHFQPLPSKTIDKKLPVLSLVAPLPFSLVKDVAGKITRFAFNNVASRIAFKRTWHVKKAVFCARNRQEGRNFRRILSFFVTTINIFLECQNPAGQHILQTTSTFDPFLIS